MKPILFLIALFFSANACIAQEKGSLIYSDGNAEMMRLNSVGELHFLNDTAKTDTLIIPKEIRFIKIDGELYEIKRKTEIIKVNTSPFGFFGTTTTDCKVCVPANVYLTNPY